VKHDSSLKPLTVSYPPFSKAKFLNNGHSVQFQPDVSDNSSGMRNEIFDIRTKPVNFLLFQLKVVRLSNG